MAVLGHKVVPQKEFMEGVKKLKSLCKVLDTHLKGKQFLVGDSLTLADVVLGTSLIIPFQTVLDAGFRKGMGNLSNWFIKLIANKSFINTVGIIKPCEKALPAFNPDGKVPAAAAAKPAKKADDDMDDLFGDDDEDDAEANKAAVAAAAAKGKKGKKEKPPEMSLIIFEVKPLDDTTSLDEMAKRIFAMK